MRGYSQLPEGYAEKLHIDIQKDKKLSILLNVFSIVIAVTMIVIAVICRPYRWADGTRHRNDRLSVFTRRGDLRLYEDF